MLIGKHRIFKPKRRTIHSIGAKMIDNTTAEEVYLKKYSGNSDGEEPAKKELENSNKEVINDNVSNKVIITPELGNTDNTLLEIEDKPTLGKVITFLLSGILVALLSMILRIKGTIELFPSVDVFMASIVIGVFFVSEITLANVLLRFSPKKTFHKYLNYFIIGLVQIILLMLSFTLEFSATASILIQAKNKTEIIKNEKSIIESNIKTIDDKIKAVQTELNKLSEDEKRITLRKNYQKSYDSLLESRKLETTKLENFYKNSDNRKELVDGNGLSNSAELYKIDNMVLGKIISIAIAGVLNVIYLVLIYASVSEYESWRRKRPM